ncbi:MAG TPA: response regulator [Myxococcales bacterium]|jgi:two-component system phosphate regulon response regulator PhoB
MARILIVDDERDLRHVVAFNLEQEGHQTLEAEGGLEGLWLARRHRPDLVLLDLMLPDLPGLEVCRVLKAHETTRTIPLIMLTARGEAADRVLGLELGAEDYVIKPFSVRELLLRVGIALGRQPGAPPAASELTSGPVRVDGFSRRAWVHGRALALSEPELRLLARLVEHRGRAPPRVALTDAVWGAGADVEEQQLEGLIDRLREKLGAAGERIEAVEGGGYRFRA